MIFSVDLLSSSTSRLLDIVFGVLPQLIVAILIVLVGWVVGWLLERALRTVFRAVPVFDETLRNIGVEKITERAGMRIDLGKFFGVIVKVFVMFAFLLAAFDVLGLGEINRFLTETVLTYIPNVFSAALVMILGLIVADFVSKIVSGGAKVVKVHAGLATKVTKWSIIIFSALIALAELGVAQEIIQATIGGIIAAISLGLGLAFGLGGQQAASDFLDRVKGDITNR
ncbi:MAG: hypothetical protein OXB96_02020 [Candidatus Kaiserbacteria bacterium]|nr:hypothetical protein [Candidatus Kaiserbacteria bacterium]